MPAIPRVNINLTCIMIGEYVSDWMCDEASPAAAERLIGGVSLAMAGQGGSPLGRHFTHTQPCLWNASSSWHPVFSNLTSRS
jgi:hypothetical protein